MAKCYRCGRQILKTRFQLRRLVKTGAWFRRRYQKETISSTNIHDGMRVVCSWRAQKIDRRAARGHPFAWAFAALALILLGTLIWVSFT